MKTGSSVVTQVETNNLFPVFLKLEELTVLLVGAGKVGLEKLSTIISNSPLTRVLVVATEINDGIRMLASNHENIRLAQREYSSADLEGADLVITAIDDSQLSGQIRKDAKARGKLLNAADKPELCDFYLGSIVKKGNLKIAISTNGKSPTIAKRLKEIFNDVIPGEIDGVLQNMNVIRNRLNGHFAEKVRKLNSLTKDLVLKNNAANKKAGKS